MNIIQSKVEDQQFWLSKRDKKLEEAYCQIAPNIPHVNIKNKKLFFQKCKEYFEGFLKNDPNVQNIERWDEYEIERMFGKGLNPTSLKTALNDINFCVSNIHPDGDVVRVLEFGPGSGWSTLMLYRQLNSQFPDKKVELYSVDISPYSIVSTENSLDYYQIPWQTVSGVMDFTEIQAEKGRVTLILDDFVGIISKAPDNYFDGFFSSHGTAYLSDSEYAKLLKILISKGKNGVPFVSDSLDPLYTVVLQTLHLIRCSLNPSRAKRMQEYYYGKSLRSNSKYFPGQEVKKLVKVNNEESFCFYYWNNYLIRHLKIPYLLQMLKSMRITTDVIEEYREDVYPSYLLENLMIKNNLVQNYVVLQGRPKSPLYISNAGFMIKK